MNTLKLYKIYVILFLTGLIIGKFVLSSKKQVETKEVEKIVYIEKKEEKKNVKTIITEKKNLDGSSETITIIDDKTTIDSNITLEKERESYSKTSSRGISLGLLAINKLSLNFDTFKPDYGLIATIPLLGSISTQTLLTTDKKIGLGLSFEF